MKISNRINISILSFLGTILFAFPQALVIMVAAPLFLLGYFGLYGYVSLAFLLMFAYNIGKLVQHFHDKSQEK